MVLHMTSGKTILKTCLTKSRPARTRKNLLKGCTYVALTWTEPIQLMVPMSPLMPRKAQPEQALWGSSAALLS